MESPNYLHELDSHIKTIEKAASELISIGQDNGIPAVYKNARRIVAAVNILKIEVSDVIDLQI